jgi:hypothetical protein
VILIRSIGIAGASVFAAVAVILSALAVGLPARLDGPSAQPPIPMAAGGVHATFAIPVQLGWNFISIPLVQWDESVLEVLDDCDGDTIWDRAMWYDPFDASNHYKQFNTNWNPALNDLVSINHTIGFQLNVTALGSDGELAVNGTLPGNVSIALREGQNWVGYPANDDSSYTIGDLKADAAVDRVENNDSVPYIDTYIMKRGEGYWVNATSNCTWTLLNPPTGFPPSISLVSPSNNSVIRRGVPIVLEVNGSQPSVSASVNGGSPVWLSAPYEFDTDAWTDGEKTLSIEASDANGTSAAVFRFVADSTSPTINLSFPTDGSRVRVGAIIDLNISDANIGSVNYTTGGTDYVLAPPFDIPTTGWEDGYTTITVYARDLAGNHETAIFGFTFDGTNPWVKTVTPSNGTEGVSIASDIVVRFSERMNRTAVESAFSISPAAAVGNFDWNADSNQMTVRFAANLTHETLYRLSLSSAAKDDVGNPINETYRWQLTTWTDTDGDGIPNNQDQDDDGDGVVDIADAFPLDPDESVDTDGDDVGDNADLDDDGDAVLDDDDAFPLDKWESKDSDGDGTGDNTDEFPNDETETTDSDGDGVGDNKDFLPNFNNNLFYSLAILAPCITAVLVALIVTRARRPKKPAKGEPKGDGGESPAEEDEPPKRDPVKRKPHDAMAPPPDD